jgi:hypothetical protein
MAIFKKGTKIFIKKFDVKPKSNNFKGISDKGTIYLS